MPSSKVDFIGIGAEKAATDWVALCLREHPEVCFSRYKELVFFCEYDQHMLKVEYRQYERGIDWYEKHFRHCPVNSVKGEYTPTYLYSQVVARRIHKHYPNIKLIACLRDPVQRAFSQYLHDRSIGLIRDSVTFEEALQRSYSYVEKGLYAKYLTYYYDVFPREQILVLVVDDIGDDSRAVLSELYGFLGLNDVGYTPPSMHLRPNAAAHARWPWLNRVMLHTDYFLREHHMDGVLRLLEDTGLRRIAISIGCHANRKPISSYPVPDPGTVATLRQAFIPDIERLENLLGRDLSQWKGEPAPRPERGAAPTCENTTRDCV